ncbi:MAG: nucleotide-binding protein [Candidatus Diapherotrites archaeon]|nr:nucleotide-binding protein [Candidatus Diapherotrites archaeon]
MARSYKVIIDANFAMVPVQFRVDIYNELKRIIDRRFELITFTPIIEEIKGIKGGKLAIEIMKKNGVKIIETKEKTGDKAIMDHIKARETIVCTNDKELEKKLREKGVTVIYLRGKKKIEAKGEV